MPVNVDFVAVTLGTAAFSTATFSSHSATCDTPTGVLTTESETTAAGSSQTYTVVCAAAANTDAIFVSVANVLNTQGTPVVGRVEFVPTGFQIVLLNIHASQAFNGTLKLRYTI